MSTSDLQLKLEIISRITELKEVRVIKEIKKILAFELEESLYELSTDQKNRVAEARKEYRNGDYITNEEAENEIDQWLKEE
ncbi:hypothetical protein MG290_06520 [Flavobacterium sp. CBA20B-1]|uniref:hypothetical protein n=1 Tax=unclassified Flavobacterium TaxID=196869 RepID=UPI002224EBEF|nr:MULTISPECIES: hypothetical protein [unclassified Flavobacterium]WCM43310.1 hypothetical protein MG290_06520 [Flavobacterium sp. CBA20B-1]